LDNVLTFRAADDLRARIQSFKEERIGGRRKEFVETVVVESKGEEGDVGKAEGAAAGDGGDVMDLS
jgi:hypothetical protein